MEVVRWFLDLGVRPDVAPHLGRTGLHWAIPYGHLEVIRLLLEHDIGGPLLERVGRGRPKDPTMLGEQVIAALTEPTSLLNRETARRPPDYGGDPDLHDRHHLRLGGGLRVLLL